jgi:hypothetical protein
MIVLMIVCVIIRPTAVVPRAGSFLPQSPRALSATQSRERNVRRHVRTRHWPHRQRLGAVMSTAGEEQTDESHRGEAERSSDEWEK